MIKILFSDGKEKICEGKVKHHNGSQPALCSYDLEIEGNTNPSLENLKLVYDDITEESVYFLSCSYGFYKCKEKYEELYKKSLRDLKLIKKFKEYFNPFIQNMDFNDLDNLAECLVLGEDEISNIYKMQ